MIKSDSLRVFVLFCFFSKNNNNNKKRVLLNDQTGSCWTDAADRGGGFVRQRYAGDGSQRERDAMYKYVEYHRFCIQQFV